MSNTSYHSAKHTPTPPRPDTAPPRAAHVPPPQVSYGPTIRGAHSPDERVLVPSVAPFFSLTLGILSRLADVPHRH